MRFTIAAPFLLLSASTLVEAGRDPCDMKFCMKKCEREEKCKKAKKPKKCTKKCTRKCKRFIRKKCKTKTERPTKSPKTDRPTKSPKTERPTKSPKTERPTKSPKTNEPTTSPTASPTASPTIDPTLDPTAGPTLNPTADPTASPTKSPGSGGGSGSVIDASWNFSCAVVSGGGVKCWGRNLRAQLGNGSRVDSSVPVDVQGLSGPAVSVSLGQEFGCALIDGGDLECWGRNGYGQLGDGVIAGLKMSAVSVQDLGGKVVSYSAGFSHTCAVTSVGDVKCFGYANLGELGDGIVKAWNENAVSPLGLDGIGVAVGCGRNFSCAIVSGGGVKCWGHNPNGQLGNGSFGGTVRTPVDVLGLNGPAVAIDAGGYHTCAIISGGSMQCWGQNTYGQLGDGASLGGSWRNTATAVQNLGGSVVAISTGFYHTCAVLSGGGLQCWGFNLYGQIGDGATAQAVTVPTTPVGLGNGIAVGAGLYHTCGVVDGGEVKCWGFNKFGELGNGLKINVLTPVTTLI